MKDYYEILELPTTASEEQIKKTYRRLALRFHPDRNQGDPRAEERFKEIAEAYAVLADPAKRAQYDQWRKSRSAERMAEGSFGYSQEEIFRDLFRNPSFSHVFQDLFREFERSGVRFDQRFFDEVFFGGRGVLFGGVFVWGSPGSNRTRVRRPGQREDIERHEGFQFKPSRFLKRLWQKIDRFLLGGHKALPHGMEPTPDRSRDLTYTLTLPSGEARGGTWVTISVEGDRGSETLKVKIPPGTRSGTLLRLKGKGIRRGRIRGDLYLTVHHLEASENTNLD